MYKKKYPNTEDSIYKYGRKNWLKQHPEDLPMDAENMAARRRGYDNKDIRRLMAAVCLRACVDYKSAVSIPNNEKSKTIKECREFFGSDIFQCFVNGMSVPEIEKRIRATPNGAISSILKSAIK